MESNLKGKHLIDLSASTRQDIYNTLSKGCDTHFCFTPSFIGVTGSWSYGKNYDDCRDIDFVLGFEDLDKKTAYDVRVMLRIFAKEQISPKADVIIRSHRHQWSDKDWVVDCVCGTEIPLMELKTLDIVAGNPENALNMYFCWGTYNHKSVYLAIDRNTGRPVNSDVAKALKI